MSWKKDVAEVGRAGELSTIIGRGTVIEGSVSVVNSLRVDGRINGNVSATESLVVGKDGEIKGEINVANAVIGGHVEGKILAKGKVVLEAKAYFRGELRTSKLVIDEGAFFDGSCHMAEQPRDRKQAARHGAEGEVVPVPAS
ncbi:MAG: polymer-forming cytoskeletal protein [bacterium]|jgi:cytoskeletal protein CcmA (bactofilin family)|nr:polymer-forming cytoskeletal protein [candidate division KSB1 bacterium]MDH7559715.1 polymer-forming cytoskeletal protein [bacterium]